jgi:hypothetical protein
MDTLSHAVIDPKRVLGALMALHRAFPLERRIRQEACDSTRETYVALLLRWVKTGAAPVPYGFDREALDELVALDAVNEVGGVLVCPPFAVETDIAVHFPHATVHALSAIDALALPRLVGEAATIVARCAISGAPVSLTLTAAGGLSATEAGAVRVALRKVASRVDRYALDLAPGIRFVTAAALAAAGRAAAPPTLSLAEAVAVAQAFYGFQRLLVGEAGGDHFFLRAQT